MTLIPPDKSSLVLISEPLRPGGSTIYAASLVRGLMGAGLSPRLAAPEGPPSGFMGREAEAALELFPGLMGGLLRPFVARRLTTWTRERKPSLVHGLSAFTAPICQKLAQALEIPYLLSVQHYQAAGGLKVDERCKAVLACSESIRENLVNDARISKELVRVVPIGTELPAQIPPRFADASRLPLVVSFAKLTKRKDVGTLLRAARQVLDVLGGACQFLIVGEGPEEPALRALVRELKLEKQVTFSHPGVPHGQILADADVYVQTSLAEGFGVSSLGAMAWGVPVVATSVGGLITLVNDGQTGYLVPVSNPGAVAGKILELLSRPDLRREMGARAREVVSRQYTVQQMISSTVQAYAEVLGLLAAPSGIYRFRSPSGQYRSVSMDKPS